MKNIMRTAVLGLSITAIVGFAATVSAQDKRQDKAAIVKERQDTMKRQAGDLKYIADFAKGAGGDQENAGYKADELLFTSGKLLALFVPGTSNADLPNVKTYAKPDIWTDWKKFSAQIPKVQDLEQALSDAVKKGGKPAILAAIGNLGKNGCGACHATYRAKMPQQ
ncbi:MAG TPA: cytochrome c [Stellaceae bacterium]|nr:cytochrome c [Stellaceae bacterium]